MGPAPAPAHIIAPLKEATNSLRETLSKVKKELQNSPNLETEVCDTIDDIKAHYVKREQVVKEAKSRWINIENERKRVSELAHLSETAEQGALEHETAVKFIQVMQEYPRVGTLCAEAFKREHVDLEELRKALRETEDSATTVEHSYQSLSNQLKDDAKHFYDMFHRIGDEKMVLSAKVANLETAIKNGSNAADKEQISKLANEIAEKSTQISSLLDRLDGTTKNWQTALNEAEALRKAATTHANDLKEIENAGREARSEAKKLKETLDEKISALNVAHEQYRDVARKLAEAKRQIDFMDQKIAHSDSKLLTLQESVEQMEKELEELRPLKGELRLAEANLELAKTAAKAVEQKNTSLDWDLTQASLLLSKISRLSIPHSTANQILEEVTDEAENIEIDATGAHVWLGSITGLAPRGIIGTESAYIQAAAMMAKSLTGRRIIYLDLHALAITISNAPIHSDQTITVAALILKRIVTARIKEVMVQTQRDVLKKGEAMVLCRALELLCWIMPVGERLIETDDWIGFGLHFSGAALNNCLLEALREWLNSALFGDKPSLTNYLKARGGVSLRGSQTVLCDAKYDIIADGENLLLCEREADKNSSVHWFSPDRFRINRQPPSLDCVLVIDDFPNIGDSWTRHWTWSELAEVSAVMEVTIDRCFLEEEGKAPSDWACVE